MSEKISVNINPLIEELENTEAQITSLSHRRKEILVYLSSARDVLDKVLSKYPPLEREPDTHTGDSPNVVSLVST